MNRIFSLLWLVGLFAPMILTACASTPTSDLKMAPLNELPTKMQNAPTRVRQAYQFALANPDALKNVPCYCGCGAIGHASNYACYYDEARKSFDDHALGCSICVDITLDVMKLTREGKSPSEIRAFIVATYSPFGPPNQ